MTPEIIWSLALGTATLVSSILAPFVARWCTIKQVQSMSWLIKCSLNLVAYALQNIGTKKMTWASKWPALVSPRSCFPRNCDAW